MAVRARFLLLLLALGFTHCAAPGAALRPCPDARALTPAELYLVTREPPDVRLAMVENDSPAGDALLRAPSLPVRPDDPVLEHLLGRMRATVEDEGGVGIAAPQVGINRRVIWVMRVDQEPETPFVAYRNPEIVTRGEAEELGWEGCLSIPAGFGQVSRPLEITVAFDRPDGTRVEEQVSGFTARIFQHEIDHLDGVLFIDHLPGGTQLMPKEEYREMRRREKEATKAAAEDAAGPAEESAAPAE